MRYLLIPALLLAATQGLPAQEKRITYDEHVLPMVAPGSGNVEAIDHENHSDPISVSC